MKTNLTNWLAALCAVLLIALLVLQSKQRNELETLRQQNDKVANDVQQQTAVLYRALGKVIPVELPETLTNKLASLEAHIADEKSWPKDSAEADAMLAELRDLVRQIPPWAEDDLLPRLNAVRWGTTSLTLVTKAQAVTNEELEDFLNDVNTAIEAKPDRASELVAKRLTDIQSNPDFMKRVKKLQHDNQARVLSDDMSKFIASVDAGLAQATNEPSLTIRQITFGKLLDGVVSQRQILLENTNVDESLPRSLTDLAARIEEAIAAENKSEVAEQEKKLREYQRWALGSINSFNVQFEKARTRTKPMFSGDVKKGAVVGAFVEGVFGAAVGAAAQKINLNVSDPDYPAIEKAMTNYLTPISVGLLDTAVARLYSDAFEKGWKQLDGTNQKYLQTEVAKQEALAEKKKP